MKYEHLSPTCGDHGVRNAGTRVGQAGQETAGQYNHVVVLRAKLAYQHRHPLGRQRHLVPINDHSGQHHDLQYKTFIYLGFHARHY